MEPALPPSGDSAGKSPIGSFRRFAQLDSTNAWAIAHSAEFADHQLPMWVVADRQTSGRGRGGRSWHADSGTLTFSVLDGLDRLGLERATASRLALVAGLSVAEAIESFVPPIAARIKWPNDVHVAGGKVCGILVEAAGGAADRVVIGIGINVATDLAIAPADVRQRACSLSSVAGRPLEKDQLLGPVVDRLQENLETLVTDFRTLVAALRRRCLLSGHRVTLQRGRQPLCGWCRGINDAGALLIDDGRTIHAVESGEIVRLA